ncbi:MAG: hypothetical protein WC022_04505 [Parcubacteria group bacterium]
MAAESVFVSLAGKLETTPKGASYGRQKEYVEGEKTTSTKWKWQQPKESDRTRRQYLQNKEEKKREREINMKNYKGTKFFRQVQKWILKPRTTFYRRLQRGRNSDRCR